MSNGSNGHATPEEMRQTIAQALGQVDNGMATADALAALADAAVKASIQINSKAFRELVFIAEYMGPIEGSRFIVQVMRLRPHVNPGALRRLENIAKAFSLYEFMGKINLSVGSK